MSSIKIIITDEICIIMLRYEKNIIEYLLVFMTHITNLGHEKVTRVSIILCVSI